MTLTEAIAYIADIQSHDLDNFQGEAPSQADSIEQVNWAMRTMARKLFLFDANITLTLVDTQAEYDLNDRTTPVVSVRCIKPITVYIDQLPLKNQKGERGVWDWFSFEEAHPSYLSVDDAQPYLAVAMPNNKLRMYPAPDATAAALTNTIAGQYIPDNLTASDLSNQLPLPEEVHEALCFMAAEKTAMPMQSEAEGWRRLAAFRQEWMTTIEEIEKQNRRAIMPRRPKRGPRKQIWL